MAVRKILTLSKHEKTLRTRSEPVQRVNRDIKALARDIKDTMSDTSNAIGLAAVQIGVLKRVFGVRVGFREREGTTVEGDQIANADGVQATEEEIEKIPLPPPIIMINPEIVEHNTTAERSFDGCLSVPGMMGYTNRYTRIRVKYLDEDGKPQDEWFEDWDARMIQHEHDHIEGILFMDRLATIDDLYVIVEGDDGKMHQVPYKDVVNRAKKAATDKGRELARR